MPEDFWIRNTKFYSFRRTLREEECGKHLKPVLAGCLLWSLQLHLDSQARCGWHVWGAQQLRELGSVVLTSLLDVKAKSKIGPSIDLWAEPNMLAGSILPGNTNFWKGLDQILWEGLWLTVSEHRPGWKVFAQATGARPVAGRVGRGAVDQHNQAQIQGKRNHYKASLCKLKAPTGRGMLDVGSWAGWTSGLMAGKSHSVTEALIRINWVDRPCRPLENMSAFFLRSVAGSEHRLQLFWYIL